MQHLDPLRTSHLAPTGSCNSQRTNTHHSPTPFAFRQLQPPVSPRLPEGSLCPSPPPPPHPGVAVLEIPSSLAGRTDAPAHDSQHAPLLSRLGERERGEELGERGGADREDDMCTYLELRRWRPCPGTTKAAQLELPLTDMAALVTDMAALFSVVPHRAQGCTVSVDPWCNCRWHGHAAVSTHCT